jgi:hypothetical protein
VLLAVLAPDMRPQKHFCLMVSWTGGGVQEGRSALHRISAKQSSTCQSLAVIRHAKIVKTEGSLTKFG